MNIDQAIDMIMRGMDAEQYKKYCRKCKRLSNEKWELIDSIEILEGDPNYKAKLEKKKKRLAKVEQMLEELL